VPLLPLALIILAIISAIQYHVTLNHGIQALKHEFAPVAELAWAENSLPIEDFNQLPGGTTSFSGSWFLRSILFDKVPDAGWLIFWYISLFAFAEAAFATMALKEYLQELLGVSDVAIINCNA
jgi:hypothetical protein